VQVDGAGMAGQPGGDVDELFADGGAAGFGVAGAGEVAGGPGEIVGDGGAGQPCPVLCASDLADGCVIDGGAGLGVKQPRPVGSGWAVVGAVSS
jgi:hypothetical protein